MSESPRPKTKPFQQRSRWNRQFRNSRRNNFSNNPSRNSQYFNAPTTPYFSYVPPVPCFIPPPNFGCWGPRSSFQSSGFGPFSNQNYTSSDVNLTNVFIESEITPTLGAGSSLTSEKQDSNLFVNASTSNLPDSFPFGGVNFSWTPPTQQYSSEESTSNSTKSWPNSSESEVPSVSNQPQNEDSSSGGADSKVLNNVVSAQQKLENCGKVGQEKTETIANSEPFPFTFQQANDWYQTFYWRFWKDRDRESSSTCQDTPNASSKPQFKQSEQWNHHSSSSSLATKLVNPEIKDPNKCAIEKEKGHGRVQSVKLLSEEAPDANNGGVGRPGKSATVAFIDIRSASKALRNVRSVAGQPIQITYYEPGSAPPRVPPPSLPPHGQGETSLNASEPLVASSQGNVNLNATSSNNVMVNSNCIPNSPAPGMYRQRFTGQHGQSEDTSSHFYDQPKSFSRGRGDGHGFHGGRGRREIRPPFHNRHSFPTDNRNYRSQWSYHNEGRYAPPVHSEVDERPTVSVSTPHPPISESSSKGSRRPESPASSVSSRHLISKRRRSRTKTDNATKLRSVSESGSSDRGSSVGSRSRSGSRSSVSTSVSSSRSRSPSHHGHFPRGGGSVSGRFQPNSYSRNRYNRSRVVTRTSDSRIRHNSRSPLAASPSSSTSSSPSPHRKIAAPHSPSHSPSSSKSYSPSRNLSGSHHHNHHHHRRTPNSTEMHAAIKIRNLPIRSSDTSLKDGLYHEYKKHGKVAWVRVIGTGTERYAIVCFKSAEHATRAVSSSQEKQFFGCKIQVTLCHHTKGEETLGAQEEENRLLTEDEPTSVGYPTRTVLITGLDAAITSAELQAAFDQYGDIVRIDIRKQGTATHAVCEFVDIASAIRAQWGRHVFKSKEARISFYRNPPTNSLLLDGTAGVNDKQVYGHCCQYGAIKKIVMDPERVLALVQFEEISSAQMAIRQLRCWVIKGKHLQVDFASTEVIRRFLERLSAGLMSAVESSSPRLVSSPSIGNSITNLQENMGKRIRVEDEEHIFSTSEDNDGFKSRNSEQALQKIISSENITHCNSGATDSVGLIVNREDVFGVRTVYTSPVSPDAEHCVESRPSKSSTIKIDLNCHETDSAIVTSSSDVITVGDKNEIHTTHGLICDDKLSSFRSGSLRRTSTEISHATISFVDGVSSTSPEPKAETVRKASPDSGFGVHSVPRLSGETRSFARGLADPRRQPSDSKIRRSSADSGNNVGGGSSHMHSTTSLLPSSSVIHPPASTTTDNAMVDGNESDDRPGTPLCDENPEGFEIPDVGVNKLSRTQSLSLSVKGDPISLPLPEFALHVQRQRTDSSTSAKEFPSSSIRISRSSIDSNLKSPIKSPTSGSMNVTSPTDIGDLRVSTEDCSSPSPTSNLNWKNDSVAGKICGVGPHVRRESVNSSTVSSIDPRNGLENQASLILTDGKQRQDQLAAANTIGSPDSETGASPSSSPTSVSLEQRILKCCEKYDRWNGSRLPMESASNASSLEDISNIPYGFKVAQSSDSSSDIGRYSLTKHKFLDLDELRHQPSDIGKSVLARRSVFDEDSKRLENFGEKYEAKGSTTPIAGKNWRAIALQRSMSVSSSISSTGAAASSSNSWQTSTNPKPSAAIGISNNITGTVPHRSVSVSSVSMLNNLNKTSSPVVFQNSGSQPLKSKDLSSSCTSSSKVLKLESLSRSISSPSPVSQLSSHSVSSSHNKLAPPPPTKISSDVPKSLSPKISDTREQSKPPTIMGSVDSSTQQIPTTPSTSTGPSRPGQLPMVHQGLPRAVERSLSLDSKKVLANNSTWNVTNTGNSSTSPPVIPADGITNGSGTNAARRSSVDSHPTSQNICKSSNVESNADKHSEPISNKSNPKLDTLCPKNPVLNSKADVNDKPTSNLRSGSTNVLIDTCYPTASDSLVKDVSLKKPEIDLMKRDIMGIRHIQQETTVAVVAAEQISFLPTRSDSVGSSGSKEASEKEKEKKGRSSGTSTPVSSLTSTTPFLNAVRPDIVAATQSSSSRENIQPGKRPEELKEKKERDVKQTSDSNVHLDDVDNDPSKKISDKKDKKDSKKDGNKDKDPADHSSSNWKDSHRREKDASTKRKRHLSSSEFDRDSDPKKIKVERDIQEPPAHHRLKSTSSNERRESRDSSSSSKDKAKDSSRTSSSINPTAEQVPVKDKPKDDSKSKENHHRSKDKSASSISSKDKHPQHHVEKTRTPSESRSNHQNERSKSEHSGKDKERQKKDKVSPGKENVKGSSRHHSHGSSHRGSSSKSKEPNTGSSKSKTSTSSQDSSKRSHTEKHNASVDSDSDSGSRKSRADDRSVDGLSRSQSSGKGKSDRSEKRDSSGKRDRRKSGENPTSSSAERKKNREQKKKKRFVVEETESSDSDDDEKKKHHSIFEVVIDEYVSMYDKVKARSNRACKSNTQPHQQQQVEEVKKQDKIKDQLRQLKQSRAKKIEKKRSTSVDESNKSIMHTSSDEGSHIENYVADAKDIDKIREHKLSHSSEEDDEHHESSKSGSLKILKNKKSSSSLEKQFKKGGRKSSKSSPSRNAIFQGSSVFSNSDYDSNASSSRIHEPQRKKKRFSSKLSIVEGGESKTQKVKSSEESISDSEDQERSYTGPKTEFQKREGKSKALNKLQATDVYSDSDSSVESGPVRSQKSPVRPAITSGSKSKGRDKISKQKSMTKSLFESSDSSDEDKRSTLVYENRKEKKDMSNSKNKEKISRKKHRGHSSTSKAVKSSKKQRTGSFDGSVHSAKRDSVSTMKDILFGPMSASSCSENEDKHIPEQFRPKTPIITRESPKEETYVSRKIKPALSEERMYARSLSPCSSLELGSDHKDIDKYVSKTSTGTSEKKRKKHHKERRSNSKRGDIDEFSSKTSKSISSDSKPLDYDALFNSPRASPCREYKRSSPSRMRKELPSSMVSSTSLLVSPNSLLPKVTSIDADIKPDIISADPTKGMFSSDDDDDDDKLKIDINEAIIASSEGVDSSISSTVDNIISAEKQQREEEEKQLHSLFEQDKAIESIVLLERKSPPLTCAVNEEDSVKDDIPKDCTAISQEETEDAVAALLETLEGDDDDDALLVKPTLPLPASIHSPPTIRIIEEQPMVSFQSGDANASVVPPTMDRIMKGDKPPPSGWNFESEAKTLTLAQGEQSGMTHEVKSEADSSLGRTQDLLTPRKLSVDMNAENLDKSGELPKRRASGSVKSRQGSTDLDHDASADVYEFHDSDDERNSKTHLVHSKQTPPGSGSTSKSPLMSPQLPINAERIPETDIKPQLMSQSPPIPTIHLQSSIPPPQSVIPTSTFPPLAFVPNAAIPVTIENTFIPRTPSLSSLPITPTSRSKTPPSAVTPIRNKVDDTIEHVVRMAHMEDDQPPTPALTITSVRAGGPRGRSRSKDSVTEEGNTVSITKVLNRADGTPTSVMSLSTRAGPLETSAIPMMGQKGDREGGLVKEEGAGLETLIDPQTGILMPMMRQSDEGQYVPIVRQDQVNLPKPPQPQFSIPCFQTKPMESGKTEQEIPRTMAGDRPTFSMQPHTPSSAQKSEGLAAAMFSQQVFQQPMHQTPYGIQQSSMAPKILPQPRMTTLASVQTSPGIGPPIHVAKSSTVPYAPPTFPQGHIVKSSVSPRIHGHEFGSQPPLTHDSAVPHSIPQSISHLGSHPMGRAVFSTGQHHGPPITSQQNQYPYAVISRTNDMSAIQSIRQTSTPSGLPNVNKFVPQSHMTQGQSDLKNFQIPSATTITKVNTTQEDSIQRKPPMLQSQSTVMLSSPASHGSIAPNMVATKPFIPSTASNVSMTHQQHQQHQAQTEIFRQSAEGLIRVVGKDDHLMGKQEMGGISQPPRVDIGMNIGQASMHNQKTGRPMEPFVPSQTRLSQHSLAFDSGEVRIVSSQGSSMAESPHYGQVQQSAYPHSYTPGSNIPNNSPPTSTHGGRSALGMVDKMDFNKHNPVNTVVTGPGRPQNLQHPMSHLPSPHSIDQRNSESPMVASMYGSHRHVYQAPTPAHQGINQPMPRENMKIIYAEAMDRPQHTHSPSYASPFDNRVNTVASERESLRVHSPYAGRDIPVARSAYSPPPAHGRYSGPPAEAPNQVSNERQRIIQVQTSPHASQVPPQGDSLLMLLQRYPIMWQGLLALKNDNAACQMHFVSGNLGVAQDSLPSNSDGSIPPLRISQRMRLEQTQLEGVARKMQLDAEHCILLALPCGRDHMDVLQQSNNLRNGFITYLQLKQAAGIVNICHPVNQQPAYVIHIFPSCDFANENLARIAPDLLHGVADIAHLLIVIATV